MLGTTFESYCRIGDADGGRSFPKLRSFYTSLEIVAICF